jgi:hypothetical protein
VAPDRCGVVAHNSGAVPAKASTQRAAHCASRHGEITFAGLTAAGASSRNQTPRLRSDGPPPTFGAALPSRYNPDLLSPSPPVSACNGQISISRPAIDKLPHLRDSRPCIALSIADRKYRVVRQNLFGESKTIPSLSRIVVSGVQPLNIQVKIICNEVVNGSVYLISILHGAKNNPARLVPQDTIGVFTAFLKRAANEKHLDTFSRSQRQTMRTDSSSNRSSK